MDSTTLPEPLVRPDDTFSGRAVHVLRDLVLQGKLRGGERLNEVELSKALGISRGPLREAIQNLRSEGLLVTVSQRGAYVRTFTKRELSDLYEVRIALETHALRRIETALHAEKIKELRELLDKTERAIGAKSTYPLDLDYHQQIVSLADCPALTESVIDVHRRIHLARSRSGSQNVRALQALAEHRAILGHVEKGQLERAAEMMAKHLRSSLANAVSLLDCDSAAAQQEDACGAETPDRPAARTKRALRKS